jgi:pyruvate,orthophosphate dikinase
MSKKYVYFFGGGKAEGKKDMKPLLGGKGANIAEMTNVGLPVPPGFTITTEVCDLYYKNNHSYPEGLDKEVADNLAQLEKTLGRKFGDQNKPLLVSVRSGAADSMPGMMDTILNLGLNEASMAALAKETGNQRFALDSYRRFIQMFGDVAMDVPKKSFDDVLEKIKEKVAKRIGIKEAKDTDLNESDLEEVIVGYKAVYQKHKGEPFPEDPKKQLWAAIDAVFGSWNNPRAISYRRINDIRGLLGTAVNVQSMVFGNMGNNSATGVCFTRDPASGVNKFYGEYLINAQGEDVVAGIRTPQEITLEGSKKWAENNGIAEEIRKSKYPSMEEVMPEIYIQLADIRLKLEKHYKEMQDMEFTIQDGKLFMLQTRNGKRTAFAQLRIAVELVEEGLIDEKEAVKRVDPNNLTSLLAPIFDKVDLDKAIKAGKVLTSGLNAGPGAASGKITFTAENAVKMAKKGEKVLLVRHETSPEDIEGMYKAQGILTARGGMTSHAAVVARAMNKPCVAGAGELRIDESTKVMNVGGKTFKEGDWIAIDGFTGKVLDGKLETQPSEIEQIFITGAMKVEDSKLGQHYARLMGWANKYRKLAVRTNADTPHDSEVARKYGAQGIGLCRTEHMFFGGVRIEAMREMIIASTLEERKKALKKLLPFQREDFIGIFRAMEGLPVTIRLLDPPLHEFLPHEEKNQAEVAKNLGISPSQVKEKVDELKEFNPMLGHRGCRLGISYPEITEMQSRAILEAACHLKKEGKSVLPEIMVPLVGHYKELAHQKEIILKTAEEVMKEQGVQVDFRIGTMIEVPRAAITADKIAQEADFFSFGTNDLTQMGCGFSRDDSGSFLPQYVNELGIYDKDPFVALDQEGVGELVKIGIAKGRSTKPNLKVGICGEHGGEPSSVAFCHEVGMNYVSCSPYRVPVAILAAAQIALKKGG